jgi:hypothetical protein
MRSIYIIILALSVYIFSLNTVSAQTYATLKAENKELKAKIEKMASANENNKNIKDLLLKDTLDLQKTLEIAHSKVADLKADKESIRQNLKDMESWGLQQQKEKLDYYNETQIVRGELAQAKQKYLDEKVKHEKTISKYHRLKIFLGTALGVVLLLLYFRFGSPIVSQMAKLTGAWSPVVEILAPVSMFGLGFLIVFLVF